MADVGLAIGLGSIISGGASIAGGLIGSKAAKSAANTQAASAAAAQGASDRQFDITRSDLMPWMTVGKEGLYTLADLLGLNVPQDSGDGTLGLTPDQKIAYDNAKSLFEGKMFEYQILTAKGSHNAPLALSQANAAKAKMDSILSSAGINGVTRPRTDQFGSLLKDFSLEDFEKEPGYEFRLGEGEKGINRAALARGGFDSGATLKALQRFGQDYASGEYGNAWNRDAAEKDRKYNFLSGIGNTGQVTTQQVGSLGAQNAANQADLITGAGNARAAGIVGGANAWGNALSQIQQQLTLAQLMSGGGYSTVPKSGGWFMGKQY